MELNADYIKPQTLIAIMPVQIVCNATELDSITDGGGQESANVPKSKPFSNCLYTFFLFAYKICFSPFQILHDSNGKFYAKQWRLQQIICVAGVIPSILYRILEVHMERPMDNVQWNPALYFMLFHKILNLIFNLNVWYAMWFMKDKCVAIVQFFYARMRSESLDRLQQKLSRVVLVVGTLNTISVVVCFLFGTDILPKSKWDIVTLFKCFAMHAKKWSFCVKRFDCDNVNVNKVELSIADVILTTIFCITRIQRKVMGISEELLILIVPLTLWSGVTDFVQHVTEQKNGQLSWESFSSRYTDLNELNELVNQTFGPILLSYTLTALFYFSINLDEFLTADDTLVKYKFLVFYIFIVSTFVISAESVRQMGKLVPWISHNMNDSTFAQMSQRNLTVILHEISSHRVGMSACGLFTVTYSVLAQMTGVFVTYFIIMVQYRQQTISETGEKGN